MIFSTTSCVCWVHNFLHDMGSCSLPHSFTLRALLALCSLLLPRVPLTRYFPSRSLLPDSSLRTPLALSFSRSSISLLSSHSSLLSLLLSFSSVPFAHFSNLLLFSSLSLLSSSFVLLLKVLLSHISSCLVCASSINLFRFSSMVATRCRFSFVDCIFQPRHHHLQTFNLLHHTLLFFARGVIYRLHLFARPSTQPLINLHLLQLSVSSSGLPFLPSPSSRQIACVPLRLKLSFLSSCLFGLVSLLLWFVLLVLLPSSATPPDHDPAECLHR